MGSFYTSIHVRSQERDGVIRAIKECALLPAYVSVQAHSGWISLFPKVTESQDQDLIKQSVSAVSKHTGATAMGMLVHDSDIFWYVLYHNGTLTDVYDSDPGYFDGRDRPPTGGDTAILAQLCLPGTNAWELRKILRAPDDDTFPGEYLAEQIGQRLGLPEEFYSCGFNYMNEEEFDSVELIGGQRKKGDGPLSIVPRPATTSAYESIDIVLKGDSSRGVHAESRTGRFELGSFRFELKDGWSGYLQEISQGAGRNTIALKARKDEPGCDFVLAVQSPKSAFPTPRVEDVTHQHRYDYGIERNFEASPVVPLLQNGIRFRIGRWHGERATGTLHGMFATAEVRTDESIWLGVTADSAEDLDEVQDMLGTLMRS